MKHTISALVENKFGVLARVAGMFSGRGFNIETLNVGPMHDGKYSRITVTVKDGINSVDQCVLQLSKLVNVIEVKDFSKTHAFVSRELVLVKVRANKSNRTELLDIANLFRGNVVDVNNDSIIIECTGNPNKISAFFEMLKNYEVLEMARSGSLALERGANAEIEDK